METRQDRVSVRVSPTMHAALTVLAERNGLAVATQAMVLLRQALARTMETEAVKRALAPDGLKTAAQWRADRQAEHEVETAFNAASKENEQQ